MESLIYDYYGYNFSKNKEDYYEYKGYIFKLVVVEEDEEALEKMNGLISIVANNFDNDCVYLVKNKYRKYISSIKDSNLCLITYQKGKEITLDYFKKMHLVFFNMYNYRVDLEQIIVLWDQRLEYIQNQCLDKLNFDNEAHLNLYQYSQHAVGLAMNSLQYLRDIKVDFNRKNYSSTLTHRRIKSLDKFEFFNPFNYIIDHSSRDLSELYKNGLISYTQLIEFCIQYSYGIDEYEYILARLMFPTSIFDIIEDIATDSISYDHNSLIYKSVKQYKLQLAKLKEYYSNIKQILNIRPIDWLDYVEF